jgi:hypothetical protein
MVVAAYFGARAAALDSAQAREAQDLQVAWQLLSVRGQTLQVSQGQLQTSADDVLNGDHTLVDQVTALVGDNAAIYEAEGASLVTIASNLPSSGGNGSRAGPTATSLGSVLDGPAYDALLGNCLAGQRIPVSCHQGYRGLATIDGTTYVAAFVPLEDGQGAFVGALALATPVERIEAPLLALGRVLLLVGLGLAALFVLAGYQVFDPVSRRVFSALSVELDEVGQTATRLEVLVGTQTARADRQVTTARHLTDDVRVLSQLAAAVGNGAAMLQESVSGIWAELSHPGMPPDPQNSLHAARQAAVVAGQLGASAEQAHDLCQRLCTNMNHVIAEGGLLRDGGGDAASCAHELGEAVQRVEATLSNPAKLLTGELTGRLSGRVAELIGRGRAMVAARAEGLVSLADSLLAGMLSDTSGESDEPAETRSQMRPIRIPGQDARRSARHTPWETGTHQIGRRTAGPARRSGPGGVTGWPTGRNASSGHGTLPPNRPRSSMPPGRHGAGPYRTVQHPTAYGDPRITGRPPSISGSFPEPWYPEDNSGQGAGPSHPPGPRERRTPPPRGSRPTPPPSEPAWMSNQS